MTPGIMDRAFTIRNEATWEHERRIWRGLTVTITGADEEAGRGRRDVYVWQMPVGE